MSRCGMRSENPAEAAAARRRNLCAICRPIGRGCCPIGPEHSRGWNVAGHSIQVIQLRKRLWEVVVLFSGYRLDLRFPIAHFRRRRPALEKAFDFGRHYLIGGTPEPWCGRDWIVRNGRDSIVILVLDR